MSATETIKTRLLAGETLNVKGIAKELGVSDSLLGVAVRALRDEGHEIPTDGAGNYRIVSSNGNGKAPAKRTARKKPARKKAAAKRASVKRVAGGQPGRHQAAGTVAPALDVALVVCGLVRGEDGALRVHCREGGRTWAMMVEGVME